MAENAIITCMNCKKSLLLDMPVLGTLCPNCFRAMFTIEQWVNCSCHDCGLMWPDSFTGPNPEFECPRCASVDCGYNIVRIAEEDW